MLNVEFGTLDAELRFMGRSGSMLVVRCFVCPSLKEGSRLPVTLHRVMHKAQQQNARYDSVDKADVNILHAPADPDCLPHAPG